MLHFEHSGDGNFDRNDVLRELVTHKPLTAGIDRFAARNQEQHKYIFNRQSMFVLTEHSHISSL